MALFEYYQTAASGPFVIWMMLLFNLAATVVLYLILRRKKLSRTGAVGWCMLTWLALMLADEMVMRLYPWADALADKQGLALFVLSAIISGPLIAAVIWYSIIRIRQLLNQSA